MDPGPGLPLSAGALDVLVTVGMGPWPFDRLLEALDPICQAHSVFVQAGTSTVEPPCAHVPFLDYANLARRLRCAQVVVCHAGNTVRLVQRAGKVPIAVAREQRYGEMANDHQVDFLRHEAAYGRVVAVTDLSTLAERVTSHPDVERLILSSRPPPPDVDGEALADLLDRVCGELLS